MFAPLLLSDEDILSKEQYGILEYGLSAGIILAALVNIGVPNAYPYFKLKRKFTTLFEGFYFHFIYLLVVNLLLALVVWQFLPQSQYYLAVIIAFVFANQATYSMFRKSDEKIISAVIIDALLYATLLLGFIYIEFFNGPHEIEVVLQFLLVYAAIYVVLTILKFRSISKEAIRKHQKLIKYGKSVMVSSFLILLIANSGRIVIDLVLQDKTLVADYGFYMRWGSFVVMLHQVLTLIYFKRIYTFPPAKLDNMFFLFIGLIVLGSILTYFIIPEIGPYFFSMFDSFESNKQLYLILCFQVIFWIVLANNENVIYREKLATKMNYAFGSLVVFMTAFILFMKNRLGFIDLTLVLYAMIFVANLLQFYILYKYRNIKLVKSALLVIITFASSLFFIL